MPTLVKRFYVFISSPDDVEQERRISREVLCILTDMLEETSGIVVRPVDWKKMTPGIGTSPQDVIDSQTPDYDIYLGIMKDRYGSLDESGISYTEREFLGAVDKWKISPDSVQIAFYFYKHNDDRDNNNSSSQRERINTFKRKLSRINIDCSAGVFYKEYDDCENFKNIILVDLYKFIVRLIDYDPLVEHYAQWESASELYKVYAETLMKYDSEFDDIILYIKKAKHQFMKQLTDLLMSQIEMNNIINETELELRSNGDKYRAFKDMLRMKMEEAADAYNEFARKYFELREGLDIYWGSMMRGFLLFNRWMFENPYVVITDLETTIGDLRSVKEEMGKSIEACTAAKVAIDDLSQASSMVRRAAKKAVGAHEGLIGNLERWRIQIRIILGYYDRDVEQ